MFTSLILWVLIFLSSCEYVAVRAQLVSLLSLNGTNSIPVALIASFAASADTEMAHKQFYKVLCQIGITEDIIRQREKEIREILRSQGMVSSQVVVRDSRDKAQALEMEYKKFCEELFQMGVTGDLVPPKNKVLGLLRSRAKVASRQSGGQSGGTNTRDKG